jgi:acyl-CoA hydrolase
MAGPVIFHSIDKAADWIESELGPSLSLATPLGLGKPNQLLNTLYTRAKNDKNRHLEINTALSLQLPQASSDFQNRFLAPFRERHFGKYYPELLYAKDLSIDNLPSNIEVFEFYYQTAAALNHLEMQRNYISLNYTHVAQAIYEKNIPIILCLIAKHPQGKKTYSLSCNPDLTLDLADLYKKNGKHIRIVGVVHPHLPFMSEDSEVAEDFFDMIVESDEVTHELFSLPREPVTDSDFLIGLQASLLIPDDGTIQIGIGSLSDALVYCTILRQQNPEIYKEITDRLINARFDEAVDRSKFHQGPFNLGLYGTSEMVMDAFMHLRRANILKREVKDTDEAIRRYMHGAFFLGSKSFYQWMRERFEEDDRGLCMTKVSKVNDLYDPHELAIRRQRKNARFFNICLQATMLGSAASETLENGQVVSGVGGQYNFVAMSHELPDSHSVLLFHSYRKKDGLKTSNVIGGHGQLTIPRHLRDVFITEYGIAFTRGKTDEKVIQSMIEIADSDFQNGLIEDAVKHKKLSPHYQPPERAKNNHLNEITKILAPYKKMGFFKPFPFGSDFTSVEEKILFALLILKEALNSKLELASLIWKGMMVESSKYELELERMDLLKPRSLSDIFYQKILLGALSQ